MLLLQSVKQALVLQWAKASKQRKISRVAVLMPHRAKAVAMTVSSLAPSRGNLTLAKAAEAIAAMLIKAKRLSGRATPRKDLCGKCEDSSSARLASDAVVMETDLSSSEGQS